VKKLLLLNLAIAIFVVGGFCPSRAEVIYSEDFSSDPQFTSSYSPQPGEYFSWNSNEGVYEVHLLEQPNAYKFAFSSAFQRIENESFSFSADVLLVGVSGAIWIGMGWCDPVDDYTDYGGVSTYGMSTNNLEWVVSDVNGNQYNGPNYLIPQTWYTFSLVYDHSLGTATFSIIERETGNVYFSRENVPFAPHDFDHVWIGTRAIHSDGQFVEMQCDNIVVNSSASAQTGNDYIAYANNESGTWEIHGFDPNTNDDQLLISVGGTRIWGGEWSPDRTRLAFACDRSGVQEIYIVNTDGSGFQQVTNDGYGYGNVIPRWEDNNTLIYTANKYSSAQWEICRIDIGATTPEILTNSGGTVSGYSYSFGGFSPDRTRITYSKGTPYNAASSRVYVADWPGLDNETQIVFINSGMCRWGNNNLITFYHHSGSIYDVYTVAPDGSALTNLSDVTGLTYSVFPSFSETASHIAFQTLESSNDAIGIMTADGSDYQPVITAPGGSNLYFIDWGGSYEVSSESDLADGLIDYLLELSALEHGCEDRVLSGQFAGFLSGSGVFEVDPDPDNSCIYSHEYSTFIQSYEALFDPLRKASPVIIGLDLGYSSSVDQTSRKNIIRFLEKESKKGAIVTISWHVRNPWLTNNSERADSALELVQSSSDLLMTSSDANQKFMDDLVICSQFLSDLDSVGIPVIWRPFHEMNGNWFWWSALSDGEEGYKYLWRYIFNYMENDIGLNNLVWVFSVNDNSLYNPLYYPGCSYVDMVGIDNYSDNELSNYKWLDALNKPMGLTEVGGAYPDKPCLQKPIETTEIINDIVNNPNYEKIVLFQVWSRPWALMEELEAALSLLNDTQIIKQKEQKKALRFVKESPVDLIIEGPYGLLIDKNTNTIPNIEYYSYEKTPGDSGAVITILFADTGLYHIQLQPWASASPFETYSLCSIYGSDTVNLAADEQICNIPESGYIVSTLDTGSISGIVAGSDNGLYGVPVDLYDNVSKVIASCITNDDGYYLFPGLDNGQYSVSISTPMGYQANEETKEIEVKGLPHEVNFELIELDVTPQQRSRGYWAHQLHKAQQDKPKDYTLDDFSSFCSLINIHFNQNQINPVDFYSVPLPADQSDSLNVLKKLLHMRRTGDGLPFLKRLANAQLMALLLNVVSGKVHQTHEITADGRTISQLITYCDMLVNDEINPPDNNGCPGYGSSWFKYIYASFMLVKANLGLTIPAGMVPEDIIQIAYKTHNQDNLPEEFALQQNYPNPFNPTTTISFALPRAGEYNLTIYNITGQEVTRFTGETEAGEHSVIWDATDMASGIYLYKLETEGFTASKKMILLK